MSITSSQQFLLDEINKSIDIIKCKAKWNKTKLKLFFFITIFLSTIITMILAFDISEYEKIQKNSALIVSACLTLVSGWTARFDYQKLWFRQKATLLAMYQLRNKVNYLKSKENIIQSDIDGLFDEYKSIWEKDSQEWNRFTRNILKAKI
ncbi:SLATT domain-containing protein [Enterobacter cloacae complex sp. 284J4]|uniref:SLATT domain-containing protein n=1 Tax=Enterobacter cloacae complex sp. 284J4 TaxID=3395851 RepID=UPI003CF1CD1B